jgi:hypothetical protein
MIGRVLKSAFGCAHAKLLTICLWLQCVGAVLWQQAQPVLCRGEDRVGSGAGLRRSQRHAAQGRGEMALTDAQLRTHRVGLSCPLRATGRNKEVGGGVLRLRGWKFCGFQTFILNRVAWLRSRFRLWEVAGLVTCIGCLAFKNCILEVKANELPMIHPK